MSLLRRNPKRDAAEKPIVAALRASGWAVLHVSVRNGPDLIASRGGLNVLIEVKSGKAKLEPGQQAWHATWNGPVLIMRSVQDVWQLNAGEQ